MLDRDVESIELLIDEIKTSGYYKDLQQDVIEAQHLVDFLSLTTSIHILFYATMLKQGWYQN